MTVPDERLANSLAIEFREYIQPLVFRWIEACTRAEIDASVIRRSLSAEALVLASVAHIQSGGTVGSFVAMAQEAIDGALASRVGH